MNGRLQNRAHVSDLLSSLSPVLLKNETGEEIPPFSFLEIDDSETTNAVDIPLIGIDIVLKVIKITTSHCFDNFCSSGILAIPIGKTAYGYVGSILPINVGSQAAVGDYLVPQIGSFLPDKNVIGGPLIVYAVNSDDYVVLAKEVAGRAFSLIVRFQISYDGGSGVAGDMCSDKAGDAPTSVLAQIKSRPCCRDKLPGEDESGNITVVDTLGDTITGREASEINGKEGVATYVYDDDPEACYWMIIKMDFHEVIQVVEDVIIANNSICIERALVEVWKRCKLPDECHEGTTCPEDS